MKKKLQFLLLMGSKLLFYGIFSQLLLIGVLKASNGAAQKMSVKEVQIRIEDHKSRILDIFSEIENQTDFTFIYDREHIDRKVKLNVSGIHTVNDVLLEVSKNSRLRFKQINNMINVKPVQNTYSKEKSDIEVVFQSQTITGKVTTLETNEGLPGVNVLIKGTNKGTITDVEGNYSLDIPSSDVILVFSYVGYMREEIQPEGRSVINVTMSPDIQSLNDIVVVGYGEQRKISFTGAQSTVAPKELKQPVANVSTMLAGRLAGVTGVQRTGEPGFDGADIWIRGISSISGNTQPLILVDGVERSMGNIDPQDIESFTVLKDASATAVYGVRGANGVILINTKKGEVGEPKVNIDYNQGLTEFTKVPELMDGVQYMNLANEALVTRGQAPRYSEEIITNTDNNVDPFVYPNVNWMDEVFKDMGRNRQASVNINGGSEGAVYYVSLGYYDESGLYKDNALESYNSQARFTRYNVTTNVTLDVTPSTKVDLGIQGYLAVGKYPALSQQDIFTSALQVNPVEYAVMYPGGLVPGRNPNGDYRNPYADAMLRGYSDITRNQLFSNLRLTQNLDSWTKGLKASVMFAFDAYNENQIIRSKREDTWIVDVNNPRNPDGTLNLGDSPTFQGQNFLGYNRLNDGNRRFYIESSLNYDRSFDLHHISGLLLFNRSDYLDNFADNFSESIPYRNQGIAGRATYSYDDRYFVEVNVGYNGSENFAPSNRYGFFPAVGVGWAISNENFFKPLTNVIDFLKIRYTDGLVGSESGAGRFAYLGSVVTNGDIDYIYGLTRREIDGIVEESYPVNVTWAEARKQDLGIELNMFDYSFGVIFDLFKEYTEGAFLGRGDIPSYIGLNSDPFGNIGVVENKGFDGTVSFDKNYKDWVVGFRGTFSYNKNKVIENGQPEPAYPWMDRRGHSTLARFGYVAERLFTFEDDTNNDGVITPEDGDDIAEQFGTIMPGDIKYQDLNEDGRIDAYDVKYIGRGDVPALTYGFGLSLGYRNFDISVFFQGQEDAVMRVYGQGVQPFVGDGGGGNLYSAVEDRWTEENPDPYATYPRLSYGSTGVGMNNNTQVSSWWLRDIDFLRLKTAEIGYNFPERITEAFKIENARIYMRGVNLLTFTKFDLWDPELVNRDPNAPRNGSVYPNISVYSLGINLQF